jgi:hypothetical protein
MAAFDEQLYNEFLRGTLSKIKGETMTRKEKLNQRILAIWDEVETEFPYKSTEWIMETVCADLYLRSGGRTVIDHGDVSAALAAHQGVEDGRKQPGA